MEKEGIPELVPESESDQEPEEKHTRSRFVSAILACIILLAVLFPAGIALLTGAGLLSYAGFLSVIVMSTYDPDWGRILFIASNCAIGVIIVAVLFLAVRSHIRHAFYGECCDDDIDSA